MKILNLRRLGVLLIILALFLTSCNGVSAPREAGQLTIDGQDSVLKLDKGGESTLVAKGENGKALTSSKVSWSSSNFGVVSVDADGNITAKGSGLAKITATLKSDLSVKADISVFVPYKTQNESESSVTRQGEVLGEDHSGIAAWAGKWGFKIVKAALSSALPWKLVLSLVTSKDQYQFSEVTLENSAENVIMYEASGWTNQDVTISLSDVTDAVLYERFCSELEIDGYETGKSFSDYSTIVKNALQSALPEKNTYYFSHMDPSREYRVVVRGSYQHIHNESHYSNGFLEATGGTISDIADLNFGELTQNFAYQVDTEEIINISGVTVCIESREKIS